MLKELSSVRETDFVLQNNREFKAISKRNTLIAEWVAEELGFSSVEAEHLKNEIHSLFMKSPDLMETHVRNLLSKKGISHLEISEKFIHFMFIATENVMKKDLL